MLKKRLWIVYLIIALTFTMMPIFGTVVTVSAADIASGDCDTCHWVIDAKGKMTVSPINGDSGELDSPFPGLAEPDIFNSYVEDVTSIVFEGHINATDCTSLFRDFKNVKSIDFSKLVASCRRPAILNAVIINITVKITYIFDIFQ